MDCIKIYFSPFEVEALIEFLKDYTNRENLSIYEGALPRHLYLAFMKLLKSKEQWNEAMKYSE